MRPGRPVGEARRLGNYRPHLAESRRKAALGKDDLPVLVAARRERPGAAQEIENPHPIEPLAVFGDDPIPVCCEVRVPGAQAASPQEGSTPPSAGKPAAAKPDDSTPAQPADKHPPLASAKS